MTGNLTSKIFFSALWASFWSKNRGSATGIQSILLLTTQSDTFIGFLSFHVCETLIGDQKLQIIRLSETRSVPINFIWESPSGVVPSSGGWGGSSSNSVVVHASETGGA